MIVVADSMSQARAHHDGNLRFAGIAQGGLGDDPLAIAAQASVLIDEQGATPYGPPTIIFERAPDDDGPRGWPCHIGHTVTGRLVSREPLLAEDFRGLQALSLPHFGPVADLATTWRALADQARAMGWLLRPYWRLALRTVRSGDGQLVPTPELSIFLDR
ncbi:MAG: hypothetical protein ACYTF0_02165 [Planctomycetota bacterium]|jgi:hypothetical protein